MEAGWRPNKWKVDNKESSDDEEVELPSHMKGANGTEPIYPAYVVGESDNDVDELRVVAVTGPKSPPDRVADLLRRLLASMVLLVPVPAPVPEIPMVDKLLQRLLPAGARDSARACGVGQTAQIVPLRAADGQGG